MNCSRRLTDFNPRSHEGSDTFQTSMSGQGTISIHAPTRGATSVGGPYKVIPHFISIHAPTRGATYIGASKTFVRAISIHAPTRGATDPSPRIRMTHPISIHAPTRGATTIRRWHLCTKYLFQSTLPRGERHRPVLLSGGIYMISIHAPTRGATIPA